MDGITVKSDDFWRKMISLAAPIALQNLVGTLLNLVDTLMVGQLGDAAIAAVGLANQLFFLLMLLLFGIDFPLLDMFPGSMVLRLIEACIGAGRPVILPLFGLAAWMGVVFVLTRRRLISALSRLGGGVA